MALSDGTRHIHLCMERGTNRQLLVDELRGVFEVTMEAPGASAHTADLIICDGPTFKQHRSAFQAQKEEAAPLHLPLLLVTSRDETKPLPDYVWETADDVVRTPISRRELRARVKNLLQARHYSKELQRSERRYRTFVEQASDGILIAHCEGTFVEVNQRACEMTGYSRDELLSMAPEDLATEQSLAETPVCWDEYTLGDSQRYERVMQRKDGSTFPAEVSVRLVDGEFVQAIVRDITERKEREKQFHSLVQNMPGVVYQFAMAPDGTMSFPYVSPGIEKLTGRAPEAVMQNPDSMLKSMHPADQSRFATSVQASAEHMEPWRWEGRYTSSDGEVRWFKAASQPRRRPDGTIVWEGLFMDITDRKKDEERLRLQASALEASANAITLTDQEGRIVWVNPAFTELTGYTEEEAMGHTMALLNSGEQDPSFYEDLWGTIKSGSVWQGELVNQRKDGSRYVEEQTITPVLDENGRIQNFIAIKQDITDRKEAERIQARLAAIVQSSPNAIISVKPDGTIQTWNAAAEALYGYTAEEAIGAPISIVIPPDHEETFREKIDRLRGGAAIGPLETVRQRKDGTCFDALTSASPIQDKENELIGFAASVMDITRQKEVEEELRRSRERWRRLIENMQDALEISVDGIIRYANPATAELLGADTPEEVVGQPVGRFLPSDELRAMMDERRKRIERGETTEPYEHEIERFDGERRIVESYSVPIEFKGRSAAQTMVRDVTERKENERVRARLAAIITSSQSAIIGTALDGTIQTWNAAAEALYGYTAEEAIGAPISLIVPPDREGKFEELAARVQRGEPVDYIETVRMRKDGTRIDVELTVSPVRNEQGELIGFSGIDQDITERKQRKKELIEAKETAEEMNRLKSAFLANMSHEIRTPLTSIIGFAEVLQDTLEDESLEFVELIHSSSLRLKETLTSVLDLARLESDSMSLRYERVDLAQKAEDVIEMFEDQAQRKGLDLHLRRPEGPLVAEVDSGAFERMLMNLVSNAIKFTDEGHVEVRVASNGDSVVVTVEDTGIGIHEAVQQKVFDEFKQESEGFSRSYEGSGLGLTITKHLVELMGGSIALDSTKGVGTTFTLTLPQSRGT